MSDWLFLTPWTVAHQAPLSMEFFRQEYWSGQPLHSPGDTSWLRNRTWVSHFTGRFFIISAHQGSPIKSYLQILISSLARNKWDQGEEVYIDSLWRVTSHSGRCQQRHGKPCLSLGQLRDPRSPSGPMAKTSCSQCRRPRFNPWSGN